MKNKEKWEAERKRCCKFLLEEAKNKGITHDMIADHLELHRSSISRALEGKFPLSFDMLLAMGNEVGIRLELHADSDRTGNPTRNIETPSFLFAPDQDGLELYILHTKQPACLIHVIQTIPAHFVITDLFEELTPENEVEILKGAKDFFKKYAGNIDKN